MKGQASLESLCLILLSLCAVTLTLVIIALTLVKTWSHSILYEGIVCLSEKKPQCHQEMKQKIQRTFPFVSIERSSLVENGPWLEGSLWCRWDKNGEVFGVKLSGDGLIKNQITLKNPNTYYKIKSKGAL